MAFYWNCRTRLRNEKSEMHFNHFLYILEQFLNTEKTVKRFWTNQMFFDITHKLTPKSHSYKKFLKTFFPPLIIFWVLKFINETCKRDLQKKNKIIKDAVAKAPKTKKKLKTMILKRRVLSERVKENWRLFTASSENMKKYENTKNYIFRLFLLFSLVPLDIILLTEQVPGVNLNNFLSFHNFKRWFFFGVCG